MEGSMTVYGYLRVSTSDGRQSTRSQKSALRAAGATDLREEHISGTKSHHQRPVLASLLGELQEGDQLWVYDLSRLARSLGDLLEITKVLQEKGVQLRSVQQGIVETGTPTGTLMLSILGAIHQFEVSLLREKTKAGVAAAHAAGRYGGRTPKLNKAQVEQARKLRAEGASVSHIGKVLGVSRPTIYRALEHRYRVA
jgi:DNA invertase Pin-like site-specific DNA recombinase